MLLLQQRIDKSLLNMNYRCTHHKGRLMTMLAFLTLAIVSQAAPHYLTINDVTKTIMRVLRGS